MKTSPALAGIMALFGAMVLAAFFSHPDYSFVSHTTSELAGQSMPAAWIMRAGFVLFGLAFLVEGLLRIREAPLLHVATLAFGLSMIAVAIWSAAPIDPALPFDAREDALHSFWSSVVGASFALSCAARLFLPGCDRRDAVSWIGLVVSVVIPLLMWMLPAWDGLLQRGMFAVAALWLWHHYGAQKTGSRTG